MSDDTSKGQNIAESVIIGKYHKMVKSDIFLIEFKKRDIFAAETKPLQLPRNLSGANCK